MLYGAITHMELGTLPALAVLRRHCTLKTFLNTVLGVPEKIAEADACRMEHVISEETMRRWTDYLEKTLGEHIEQQ